MTDLQARAEAAADAVERLSRELDITNADHIALWLEANMADSTLGWLACRIIEAHEQALALHALQSEGWRPYIGQEVKAGAHLPDWQRQRLWIVGINKSRIGGQYPVDGIDITVSDEWPVKRKTGGFTDGFYIGRQFDPDDLEPLPAPPEGEGA